ncbi:laminin subunit alpha isoform X3 [Biomphalaria glabrata]|nr:laminin subunit alpha isoform X3 [Biomphalaria glabrata]
MSANELNLFDIHTCKSGHEYKNGDCTECSIGFYKDEEGDADCTRCPIHTTTSGRGSRSISSCNSTMCEAGFYSMDNISCLACPKRTYKSTPGNQACLPCPPGKTTIRTGSTDIGYCSKSLCGPGQEYKNNNCSECNMGFYKEEEGNGDCTECPDHKTTSGQASTSRSSCNISNILWRRFFFLKNNSSCYVCPNGTYKNFTGNYRCLKCPMNKTTIRVGSTDISNCSFYCANICTKNDPCRFTGTSSCVCPSGYYGPKCTKRCSPGCLNDSCHRMNGTCPCKEGFYDDNCLKSGSYGSGM